MMLSTFVEIVTYPAIIKLSLQGFPCQTPPMHCSTNEHMYMYTLHSRSDNTTYSWCCAWVLIKMTRLSDLCSYAALYYSGGCPDNVQLVVGRTLICPGECGFYKCTIINGFGLEWVVDGEPKRFSAFDMLNYRLSIGTSSVFYLVGRSIGDTTQGNRTSILEYTPDSSIRKPVTITCREEGSECSEDVMVMGEFGVMNIIASLHYSYRY